MNRIVFGVFIVVLACQPVVADEVDQNADVANIRQAAESYTAAFNRGDAAAVAAHWSEDGRFVTPRGKTFEGRDAILAAFQAFFEENKGTKVEVEISSIRLKTADSAIEEGTARVVFPDGEVLESIYVATHVKQDGKWQIKSIDEADPPPSHYEQLKPLEWMIGEWADGDEKGSVRTVCKWTKNRNFITRSFAIAIADRIELEGTQVIGWDPDKQVVRSWIFDSDGGFGVGLWSQEDNGWRITALQVLAGGEKASSVNILTPVDDNSFTWESINREVDGEILPNIDPLTIVRKKSDN